jgi:hypothetical protein
MGESERAELFSQRVVAGSRTYFFDVKASKDGAKYLVISESRPSEAGHEHTRVMVFEEHLGAFNDGLLKAMAFLGLASPRRGLHEIRKLYPKAYQTWTAAEDENLKARHAEGATTVELAEHLQRPPSAIRSRLARLGLKPRGKDEPTE